jgi:hypothetical protein
VLSADNILGYQLTYMIASCHIFFVENFTHKLLDKKMLAVPTFLSYKISMQLFSFKITSETNHCMLAFCNLYFYLVF